MKAAQQQFDAVRKLVRARAGITLAGPGLLIAPLPALASRFGALLEPAA